MYRQRNLDSAIGCGDVLREVVFCKEEKQNDGTKTFVTFCQLGSQRIKIIQV